VVAKSDYNCKYNYNSSLTGHTSAGLDVSKAFCVDW